MAEKISDRNISTEIKESFLDYAMSVIVSRALPDVRDGLKPVHRRILFAMNESGNTHDKKYQKSARSVGDIMGKYHPHGDSSVYDSMVRMAQDFSYRYMLIDGQGNFGSIDGDGAAAMRYTEARLSKLSGEILKDINKETVDFTPNFDSSLKEPTVLPSRFPNILVNGAYGIAVGMATSIPPHNLGEVIDGTIALIDDPDISIQQLIQYIKGPDFPTGASILGTKEINRAYNTGRGNVTVRSTAEIIELKNGKPCIIVTEIPYQVNKARLIERIAELAREKVIDGLTDLRDESSNRNGIRIVIELRRDVNANVVLNNLYKHTSLQNNFSIILLALVDGQPKILNLKQILTKYLDHQKEVIIRRTQFELKKAQVREHMLEGLKIALDNIDEIIKLIKAAKNDEDAKNQLISKFNLTETQSKAILEMKLRRLTGLEREKIEEELKELKVIIEELKSILNSNEKIFTIIKEEMLEIKTKYEDKRRTKIDTTAIEFIEDESLIPSEDIVLTVTNNGYIKKLTADTYKTQNRGGVGIKGMSTNDEDFVNYMLSMNTHDYVLFFTNKGKVYRMKGYEIPSQSRQGKGIPIINLLPTEKEEEITSMLKIPKDKEKGYLLFVTKKGVIKRTALSEFDRIRQTGKIALTLKEYDSLISVKMTSGDDSIIIGSDDGRMIHFDEKEIRVMGRTATGVKGIVLSEEGICVGADVIANNEEVLVISDNGYGKRTGIDEYRLTHRGTKGVKTLNVTEKTGNVSALKAVTGEEEVIIMTNSGIVIRLEVSKISKIGRATQGIKLMNLKNNDKVSTVSLVIEENNEEDNGGTTSDVSRGTLEIE